MTASIFARWRRTAVAVTAAMVLLPVAALAQQGSQAQQNAIRQACPADYQAHCPNTAGRAAFLCLQRNLASLSPGCRQAVGAVAAGAAPGTGAAGGAAGAASAPAAGSAPTAAAAQSHYAPPMPMREELMLLRRSCGGDFHAFCSGVPLGGGRAIACLRAHAGALSPQCGEALSAARGSR
jgi:hypothetical protein